MEDDAAGVLSFTSLSSVTQLVLDALLEQQIEKLIQISSPHSAGAWLSCQTKAHGRQNQRPTTGAPRSSSRENGASDSDICVTAYWPSSSTSAANEEWRGTQEQPEMVAGVVGLMDASASYRDARQHQQNDQRAAEVIFFPGHALSPSA
jgi:hypothetical protein